MRKRVLALLMAGAVAGGFVGIAQAAPGPNDSNNHGLCTAYFNGQKNGHDKHGSPGPFAALEEAAADDDEDTSTAEEVFSYCDGIIGGNPEHGRWTCTPDDPATEENELNCEENEAPGNS